MQSLIKSYPSLEKKVEGIALWSAFLQMRDYLLLKQFALPVRMQDQRPGCLWVIAEGQVVLKGIWVFEFRSWCICGRT